jgi:hypothetical protein
MVQSGVDLHSKATFSVAMYGYHTVWCCLDIRWSEMLQGWPSCIVPVHSLPKAKVGYSADDNLMALPQHNRAWRNAMTDVPRLLPAVPGRKRT